MDVVTFFLDFVQPSSDFSVGILWVYAPGSSPITKKDMFYTPIWGSPTIRIMVYTQFGGSLKINRNTRW